MIHVLAFVTAQPGMRAKILEAYRANLPTVLAEAGCLAYEAVVDAEASGPAHARFGADQFVVVERWESAQALQAHAASEHMKAYVATVRSWTVSTAVHVLQAA